MHSLYHCSVAYRRNRQPHLCEQHNCTPDPSLHHTPPLEGLKWSQATMLWWSIVPLQPIPYNTQTCTFYLKTHTTHHIFRTGDTISSNGLAGHAVAQPQAGAQNVSKSRVAQARRGRDQGFHWAEMCLHSSRLVVGSCWVTVCYPQLAISCAAERWSIM